MIITGYQGIGKTTLANNCDKVIDLESSCFTKHNENGTSVKPDDWYVYYCQIAENLSRQGKIVFISSHSEVRNYLAAYTTETFCAIFPEQQLKQKWLERLKQRYTQTNDEKDKRALEHAEKYYNQDIARFYYESKNQGEYGPQYYKEIRIIDSMDYDLKKLVKELEQETAK